MKYEHIREGRFVSRPNRFLAEVEIDGQVETGHVKNTGRLKELFVPGATVFVEQSCNPNRKTPWDLVQVYKGEQLVNVDSQMPNALAEEWLRKKELFPDLTMVEREKTYGSSRFDIHGVHGEREFYMEVKGVTLEVDGEAHFPDAPTERGLKHIHELIRCRQDGYEAWILFVLQMKGIHLFRPNWKTQPAFGEALQEAEAAGVHIEVRDCIVTPGEVQIDARIPYDLQCS